LVHIQSWRQREYLLFMDTDVASIGPRSTISHPFAQDNHRLANWKVGAATVIGRYVTGAVDTHYSGKRHFRDNPSA
jgi:hypothetical protein